MPVCIQFETSEETKNLYLSFLKGVIFALDGSMSQLSSEAYIFTPKGISVQKAD
jgi:FtsZ-interacting cell division protein YlmF